MLRAKGYNAVYDMTGHEAGKKYFEGTGEPGVRAGRGPQLDCMVASLRVSGYIVPITAS